jgi:D-alanine--poly(phosphoribitol) ligase subunit 1
MNNVIQYLENTTGKFPDKIAFVDHTSSVTFAELRTKARAIATQILIGTENNINRPIAIIMDKSVEMLIAYMGVTYSLGAGGFICKRRGMV